MAIINYSGFEGATQREFNANSGTWSVQTSIKRSGAYALRTNPTTTAVGYLQLVAIAASGTTSNPNVAKMRSTFWYYVATAPSADSEEIFVQRDTTNAADKLSVRIDSARKLSVYDKDAALVATGTTVLSTSTWYCIEVESNNGTSGAYDLRINQVSELSGTCNQSATNCGAVRFGKVTNRNGRSVDFYYDDITIDDADYHGKERIFRLSPTANGSTAEWTSGTNSSDYQEVDEVAPDDDTTYIMNPAVAGKIHLVTLQSCSAAGINVSSIKAFKALVRWRENTAATSACKIRVKSGATNSENSTRNIGATYEDNHRVLSTDPNTSAAWTESGVNAVEVGVVETGSVQIRATQIFGTVLVDTNITVQLTAGSYTLTGNSITVTRAYTATLTSGSYALTGNSLTITRTYTATLISGVYTLTGSSLVATYTPALVGASYTATLTSGSYSLTGNSISARLTRNISLASGSYTLTGNPISVTISRTVNLQSGSYELTGNYLVANIQRTASLTSGNYLLTGNSVNITISRLVTLQAGSYSLTGNNITVSYFASITSISELPVRARVRETTAFYKSRITEASARARVNDFLAKDRQSVANAKNKYSLVKSSKRVIV